MNEPTLAKAWLQQTLSTDGDLSAAAPGGVWEDVAGANAATPYIVYNVSAGDDDDTTGRRAASRVVVSVKVVSLMGVDKLKAEAALGRIEALLQDAKAVADDAYIRIKGAGALPEYPEPAPGGSKIYKHAGRFWRFTISSI